MNKTIKSLSLMSLVLAIAIVGFTGNMAQAATYTSADVAVHNTAANCWVIVNNNVYNLTSFISSHSGGQSPIAAQCGKDGTASFNSGPHSAGFLNALNPYLLGTLTTVQTPFLTSVTVTPATSSIVVGGTTQLTAAPKNQNGVMFVGATTTFSSSNIEIANVNNTTGLVTAVAQGSANITATSVSGSKTVVGTSSIIVTAVIVTPPTGNDENDNDDNNNNNHHGINNYYENENGHNWNKGDCNNSNNQSHNSYNKNNNHDD